MPIKTPFQSRYPLRISAEQKAWLTATAKAGDRTVNQLLRDIINEKMQEIPCKFSFTKIPS